MYRTEFSAALAALVAQLVEHGSNKPRVGGSSPSWSTQAAIAQLGERQTEDLKVPGSIPAWSILALVV